MRPKLKLEINIEADIENAKWFVRNGEFVDLFLPLDLEYITQEEMTLRKRNKIIAEYTLQTYKRKEKEIREGVKIIKKRWSKTENNFYRLVDTIFDGHDWPSGTYIGYASIFFMFPRDVKNKTFFFPYSATSFNPISTIAHELLHFMFFDYVKKNYGLKEHDQLNGKDQKYLWQVSETFNTVIENWQPYKDLTGATYDAKPYVGCEKMYRVMKNQWKKDQNIKRFLDKWLIESISE